MSDDVTSTVPSEDAVERDERPLIDSETGWNRLMVEQMAHCILEAHEVNPNSWAAHSRSGEPVLAVGFLNVISVGPKQPYELLVDTTVLNESGKRLASSRLDSNKRYGDERPWASYLRVPPNEIHHLLEALGSSNIAAVTRCAMQVQTHPHRRRGHQEDFRKQIERIAGIPIPQPEYMRELRELTKRSSGEQPILEHVAGRQYWKFSAGPKAKNWERLWEESFIGIDNWSDVKIELDALPDDHEGFLKSLSAYPGYGRPGSQYPWILQNEVRIGDLVVMASSEYVMGWGTVAGDYFYGDGAEQPLHRKPVEWNGKLNQSIRQLPEEVRSALAVWDPARLTPGQFATAIGALLVGDTEENDSTIDGISSSIDVLPKVRKRFGSGGLQYTDNQIATFYTALQTKGFVVLSGISGTGKSKIAQGFVDMLPTPEPHSGPVPANVEGYIRVFRMPSYADHGNTTLPTAEISGYTFPMESSSWKITTRLGDAVESGTLRVSWFPTGARMVQVHSKGTVRAGICEISSGTWFYAKPETDPESGRITGVEFFRDAPHVTEENSQEKRPLGENHLFLSVRPDWRDSTSLLGYFNPLTQTYEWTDFLRFILRAVESYRATDGLAWFVILDEMNLAHVEYYFADLLSVIESGRRTDPVDDFVGFTREPLRTTYPETLDDEVPPREIHLPPNLYIIGTVNMDETTHAFSPKVLDRAFTIELTDVSFVDYPPIVATESAAELTGAEKLALLKAFTRQGRFHQIDKSEVAQAVTNHPEIRDWLGELNRLLAKDRFHFGYRIFDEIAQYIYNNDVNEMMSFEEAFDQAVFMKVLPKFSGSRARLRSPLISVLAWAIDPAQPLPKQVVAELDTHLAGTSEALRTQVEGAAVPTVAKRALEMLERVELDGFVSFG